MRRLGYLLLSLFVLGICFAPLIGCAAPRPASQAYTVDEHGTVSAGTRSAMDGTTAPGPQELAAVYLPFPPFAFKAGLVWDGSTFRWGSPPAAPAAAARAATCEEVMVQETYTEMVPVQRTRVVPQRRVTLPVPQAAPQCPCPPPPPPVAAAPPQSAICEWPAVETARLDR